MSRKSKNRKHKRLVEEEKKATKVMTTLILVLAVLAFLVLGIAMFVSN